MNIVLASQSPRRKELLNLIVEEFVVAPADIDETVHEGESPKVYVQRMAREKARVVAEHHPQSLVIGSDTTVVNDGEILGKPSSRAEARQMLRRMSGKTHEVYTSVKLQSVTHSEEFISSAAVTFYELSEADIETYLDREEYADKAGAYGIQGGAALFVKEIKGDYYSIVGFPVGAVSQALKKFSTI